MRHATFLFLFLFVVSASAQTDEAARIKAENELVAKAHSEGRAAGAQGDHAGAIAIFEKAITAASPDNPNIPVLLTEKARSEIALGREHHNKGIATPGPDLEKAKQLFTAAAADSTKAANAIKAEVYNDALRLPVFQSHKEAMFHVAFYVDASATSDAVAAFTQFLALSKDAATNLETRKQLGQLLKKADRTKEAIEEFKTVLAATPNDVDALAGLAFSLVHASAVNDDKAVMQEAANHLKKYLSIAPKTHPNQKEARETLAYFKETHKITPK